MIDLTHVSCGLIPRIQGLLTRAGAASLVVRVGSRKVFAVVNALEGTGWSVDVREAGDEAVLTFTPREGLAEDLLNRV